MFPFISRIEGKDRRFYYKEKTLLSKRAKLPKEARCVVGAPQQPGVDGAQAPGGSALS